jgi:hypothetical protein
LALFWNRTIPTRDPLQMKIYEIYREYRDYTDYVDFDSLTDNINAQYESIRKTIARNGFVDVELHIYKSKREYNSDEYISLLNTYSNLASIPEPIKSQFFSKIKAAIQNFNNAVTVYDTIDLHLARKP